MIKFIKFKTPKSYITSYIHMGIGIKSGSYVFDLDEDEIKFINAHELFDKIINKIITNKMDPMFHNEYIYGVYSTKRIYTPEFPCGSSGLVIYNYSCKVTNNKIMIIII